MMNPALTAIAAAGGVAHLARIAGVSHVSVIGWRRRGEIPPARVGVIAAATGLGLRDLRPDLAAAALPDLAPALAACRACPALALELVRLLLAEVDPAARAALGARLVAEATPIPGPARRRQAATLPTAAQEAPDHV